MIHTNEFFDLAGFPFKELFDGLAYPWEALAKIAAFIDGYGKYEILGEVSPGAFIEGDKIAVGRGTTVEPGALIRGRVLIGENCEIRHGAYIRGDAIIGNNCVVGHTTEVKNSIFLNGAKAGHFAYIGDSILGGEVNLGAGTKLANLKFEDECCVKVSAGTVLNLDTGLRKMGAIIGDRSELGCNTVTTPGSLIGPDSLVYPNATVRGYLPAKHVLKVAQCQDIIARRV